MASSDPSNGNAVPSYMRTTRSSTTRRAASQPDTQQGAGLVQIKGTVVEGPGGSLLDLAARISGAKPRAPLDTRLRAKELVLFLSRPSLNDQERAKVQAVTEAIERIPHGLVRLRRMADSYPEESGSSKPTAAFFETKTQGRIVAYIKSNLPRWLDQAFLSEDDNNKTHNIELSQIKQSNAESLDNESPATASQEGNEDHSAPTQSTGHKSGQEEHHRDASQQVSDVAPAPSSSLATPNISGTAINLVPDAFERLGAHHLTPTNVPNAGIDGEDAAGAGVVVHPVAAESQTLPISPVSTGLALGNNGSTNTQATVHQTSNEAAVQCPTPPSSKQLTSLQLLLPNFSTLADGSEAYRYCCIEWEWARRYKFLSYTDFRYVAAEETGIAHRYAKWLRDARPAHDHNPVPQWVREEEYARARRLNLPLTKYPTARINNGICGLPGGGYGAWRKDSRGRWVRFLDGGKSKAPKYGVFLLVGDWSDERTKNA